MPGIEVVPSPASPEHPDRPLFKSHKSLPRRTNTNHRGEIPQPSPPEQDGHFPEGLPLTTAPILPLTPPGVTHDESPTGADAQKPSLSSHSVVTVLTPSRPSHPPTPETTPPRAMASNRPGLSQFGYVSSSSRAESFKTAYETISDAETVTPRPSPPLLSRSNTQRSTKSTKSKSGVTATAEGQSPNLKGSPHPKAAKGVERQSPASTDASRKQGLADGQAPELRIKPTRKKPKQTSNITDTGVIDVDAPTRGRGSLRDRVAHMQQSEDSQALDQFRQEIGWPSGDYQVEDSRRLSGVSTTSTVEAMIVDKPQPARRALRHTEKRLSLRSASSPITRSERTSIASSLDLQRRLSHKPGRITENDRRSIASEISVSGSSTLGASQQHVDVVPVVVIPQRHSSLKGPSSLPSRNPSISRSGRSVHASTVPKIRAGSLDLPRHGKRSVSDPRTSNVSADDRGRGMSRPHIPPRSSSLSAPTSQNNSRAASLTSESLRSHNLAVEQTSKKRKQPELKPSPVLDAPRPDKHEAAEGIMKTQSIVIGVEDLSYLRPPSVPFTPHSVPSSSPGPFEINEVRRVAIFPHNNESLLLVNPHGQSGLRGQLRQTEPPQPQTPDDTQQMADVDSPLRNPRPPPKPPVSTSAGDFVNFDQLGGKVVTTEIVDGTNRRSKSKRQPWIARPRSESFNSFVRTLSLSSAKNPKAGEDIDGRLQPFWRPRRFWDDSPESMSPEEDGTQSRGLKQPDEVINNSLGMPQKRTVLDGPSVSSTRPGPRRRIDGHHRANREALMGSRILSPEALYSQTSLRQRHFPAVSWWRLRFRSGIARSLHWRLRRSMQQRAEGRREVKRERLKQSIGEAVLMDSSTQVRKAIS
ncbi:hypothetical protein BDW74DRAFT_134162 [Aspergillus multicolor]|uniref:uncharacterized protein n=1 Tax=Aspergillus multicolor TaxID=41759 RepID=UPI003CCDEDFB